MVHIIIDIEYIDGRYQRGIVCYSCELRDSVLTVHYNLEHRKSEIYDFVKGIQVIGVQSC